jgi:hypothetical protein
MDKVKYALLLLLVLTPGLTVAGTITGETLKNYLDTSKATEKEYATGMVVVGDVLFKWEGKSHCKPEKATLSQAVAITEKFLSGNPELWHENAYYLVGAALGSVWPCNKTSN